MSSPGSDFARPGSITFLGLKPTLPLRQVHGSIYLGQRLALPVIALSTDAVLDTYVRLITSCSTMQRSEMRPAPWRRMDHRRLGQSAPRLL